MRIVPYQTKSSDLLRRFLDDGFFLNFPLSPLAEESRTTGGDWYPAMDLHEQKDQYLLKVELPGMKKEDIKISFEHGALRIDGERKYEAQQNDQHVHRIERYYGRFARVINLGTDVDQQKIRANYKDGILEVSVPKSEVAKPRSIDIQVG